MNFNRKPEKRKPEDDPSMIEAHSTAEFEQVIARRDRGEFRIVQFGVGERNSSWWFKVARSLPRQLMLI